MKKLIIITDNSSRFLVSIPDLKNYRSMEVNKFKDYFQTKNFQVDIFRYNELDLTIDYSGQYVMYQTSEAPGAFYKRYIEDVIFFLEKQGAIVLPKFEYLKAHHNKVYMEMMRNRFADNSLKTIKSRCFGSWEEARNFKPDFPVVIKQAAGAGSSGVFLVRNQREYYRIIRKKCRLVLSDNVGSLFTDYLKNAIKKLRKLFSPESSVYLKNITTPLSKSLIVQNFIAGLTGDYKVLIFGNKYFSLYRKNRDKDFRASGSGKLFVVPEQDHEGLLNFAKKITSEIDFPILGIDIGFDGENYHLLEFQMIHVGPYTLQSSKYWHEYHNGSWIRIEGNSDLEYEYARAIYDFINNKNSG